MVDLDQFVEPVGAGMTLQNCLAPMRRQSAGELRIGEQTLQLPLHLRTVTGYQIIFARVNRCSLSSQGARTRGMPQASDSNGRMVGTPGKALT